MPKGRKKRFVPHYNPIGQFHAQGTERFQIVEQDTLRSIKRKKRKKGGKLDQILPPDEEKKGPDPVPLRTGLAALEILPLKDDKQKLPENPAHELVGKHPFRSLISGDSHSGKTTMLINVLNNLWGPYFDKIVIWTPNYKVDSTWRNFRYDKDNKKVKAFTSWDEAEAEKIWDEQAATVKNRGVLAAPKMFWLVDDMVNEREVMHSPVLKRAYSQGRHNNLSVGISVQKYNAADRMMRTNANMLHLFRASNRGEFETIYKEHGDHSIGHRGFAAVYDFATKPEFGFLTINKRAKPDEIYRSKLNELIPITPELKGMSMTSLDRDRYLKQVQQNPTEERETPQAAPATVSAPEPPNPQDLRASVTKSFQ